MKTAGERKAIERANKRKAGLVPVIRETWVPAKRKTAFIKAVKVVEAEFTGAEPPSPSYDFYP